MAISRDQFDNYTKLSYRVGTGYYFEMCTSTHITYLCGNVGPWVKVPKALKEDALALYGLVLPLGTSP